MLACRADHATPLPSIRKNAKVTGSVTHHRQPELADRRTTAALVKHCECAAEGGIVDVLQSKVCKEWLSDQPTHAPVQQGCSAIPTAFKTLNPNPSQPTHAPAQQGCNALPTAFKNPKP